MNENGTYSWAPNGSKPIKPRKAPDFGKFAKKLPLVLLALILILGAVTCWYTVDDKQQAVVTTFGKVTDITSAGVHFKAPFGIQQVQKVDVNVYQKIELGYTTSGKDYYGIPVDNESSISGDALS